MDIKTMINNDEQKIMAEVKMGIAGYFKMEKLKTGANGEPIESTREVVAPWQKNLILNQGLDMYMGSVTAGLNGVCRVGTGSTTPANSQTALVSQIAYSSTIQASTYGTQNSSSPYYGWTRKTYRFIAGVATGNISEVGIGGSSATNLFSRALVLDGLGAPTTITILSDEVLDVIYELRNYVPTADVTGTMTLGTAGGSYDYNLRAVGVNASINTLWDFQNTSWSYLNTVGGGVQYYSDPSNTQLAQVAAYSSGTSQTGFATATTIASYTNGNYYRDMTTVVDLNYSNHTSGFGRISWPLTNSAWSLTFNPIIPKTNTKKFTFTIRYTVARV